jgi:lysophospholipase L1-like esterase
MSTDVEPDDISNEGTAGSEHEGGAGSDASGSSGASGGSGASGAAGSASHAGGRDAAGDNATGASFDPCPNGKACAILPLGDSITAGSGSSGGGYRVELFRNAVLAKKTVTFVGSQSEGPDAVGGVPFPKRHEGHPGYTIDGQMGILQLTVNAIRTAKPNIVTLMIGTNDVNGYVDLPNAPKRLGNLIDTIVSADPNLLLVVAKIVPTTDDDENTRIRAYNDAIPGVVQPRAAAGKHVILVDMYAAFVANADYKTAYMDNFIHPDDAGYAVIGDVWYGAISAALH